MYTNAVEWIPQMYTYNKCKPANGKFTIGLVLAQSVSRKEVKMEMRAARSGPVRISVRSGTACDLYGF